MRIAPNYFWYDMSIKEVEEIVNSHVDSYRNSWEQTRIVAYNAAAGMSKMPTITKFLPFEWDSERDEKQKTKPSKERMLSIVQKHNTNKNGKL